MSVFIANAHVVRLLIQTNANANAHGKYDALLLESSVKILAGASVITAECVSHHSSIVIVTVNVSVLASSTAHVRSFLAIRHAIVFASKSTTVPNRKSLMRKLANVNAQQSNYV